VLIGSPTWTFQRTRSWTPIGWPWATANLTLCSTADLALCQTENPAPCPIDGGGGLSCRSIEAISCSDLINPLMGTGNYSATSNNRKLVHWPLIGGLLHLLQRWGNCGPPIIGASNAAEVGTNRDSGRIAGYRSIAAAVCDQQLTVVGAVVYESYETVHGLINAILYLATQVNQLVGGDGTSATQTATSRISVQTTRSRSSAAKLQDQRYVHQRHTQIPLLRRQQGNWSIDRLLLCFHSLCCKGAILFLPCPTVPASVAWNRYIFHFARTLNINSREAITTTNRLNDYILGERNLNRRKREVHNRIFASTSISVAAMPNRCWHPERH